MYPTGQEDLIFNIKLWDNAIIVYTLIQHLNPYEVANINVYIIKV